MITSRVRILGILVVMLGVGSALRAQSPHLVNSRSLDRVISAIRPDEVAKAVRRVTLEVVRPAPVPQRRSSAADVWSLALPPAF